MKVRVASLLLLPLLLLPGCLTYGVISRSGQASQGTQVLVRSWSTIAETRVQELETPRVGFCVFVHRDDGSTCTYDVWAPKDWYVQEPGSQQDVWVHDPKNHGPGLDLPPARFSWSRDVLDVRGHAKDVSVRVPGSWRAEYAQEDTSPAAAVAWGLLVPFTVVADVALAPLYLVGLLVAAANGKLIGF